MLAYLPDILDGLLNMLSDPNRAGLHSLPGGGRLLTWATLAVINCCFGRHSRGVAECLHRPHWLLCFCCHSRVSQMSSMDHTGGHQLNRVLTHNNNVVKRWWRPTSNLQTPTLTPNP
jgi:hypothetical protein